MTGVLVAGAGGQLGRELCRAPWAASVELEAFDSRRLDITDRGSVDRIVASVGPEVIINAAAYTAVDLAEEDEARAFAVNADGVEHLARAADAAGALLIHISTDYVFDGTKAGWYAEDDPISPVGVYGRSKAAGETAALTAKRSIVLRTAWVYGALGSNFVTTVLRLAGERDELRIIGDQIGCPTATADISKAIVEIVDACPTMGQRRTYHLAAPDQASWYELATATLDNSAVSFDGDCHAITTAEYPTKAERPANSRLSSELIERDFGIRLPSWRVSLATVVEELQRDG